MLYKKSKTEFSKEVFRNPDTCYRGAPFWAWNCYVTKEMIDEQIRYFQEMGMGGFHIHVRVGLKNQYLDDEFLELVRYCDQRAKERGMLCWLYDEDRYSSGIAGGEVTKTIAFRSRNLRLSVRKREDITDTREQFLKKQADNERTYGCLLKVYDIVLEDGYLEDFRVMEPGDDIGEARGTIWYVYEEIARETPWCNNQTYVDTLNPAATKDFIEKTHEKYASVLQEEFGESVPAIFTDEPHFSGMGFPAYAEGKEDICLPFTEEMPEKYRQRCGMDFYQALPDIIWNRKGKEISPERYYLYEVCAEQFASAYCRPLGQWCGEHNLLSTGHILGEESLAGQAGVVGEAMRCYREFQLPGIDNLCDNREYSAAKQAASVARQYGREGALSELYGVTQWDFDFEGYKLSGDWQAALGITTRVPHLAWASMAGEAKRDYPAAIGWQSPWYRDFNYIEDHFARVNYCLTRGEPVVHVGVIHPIETMWLYQGPADQAAGKREQLEADFRNLTEWLLTGGVDFDYISESLLENFDFQGEEDGFVCGKMKYQVVLVPDCINLRDNTFRRLKAFRERGGAVFFCGTVPRYLDCAESEQLGRFVKQCRWIPMCKNDLLDALEPWRELEVRGTDGGRKEYYLHQLRQEKSCRWLFLAQAYKGLQSRQKRVWGRRPLHAPELLTIRLKGHWLLEKWDTLTGQMEALESRFEGGSTAFKCPMYGDDSLLLRLLPVTEGRDLAVEAVEKDGNRNGTGLEVLQKRRQASGFTVSEPVAYQTDESNVFLLDRFAYALGEEAYAPECELLKVDNLLRERLGYPLRTEFVEQPYVRKQKDSEEHMVWLRTAIWSDVPVSGCRLALEEPWRYSGTLNGREICMKPVGYYVDKALQTVELPALQAGENELVLHFRFVNAANLEWMYLLGEFGVQLLGSYRKIVRKPEQLFWGDYTGQGFPFYTGNMIYHGEFTCEEEGDKILRIPYYAGAAVKVSVDGGEWQMAALLPNECILKDLKKGNHRISIICLGNRFNGFGQLHMIGDDVVWLGPNSWRCEGTSWTDVYQIKPMGVLSAPVIL